MLGNVTLCCLTYIIFLLFLCLMSLSFHKVKENKSSEELLCIIQYLAIWIQLQNITSGEGVMCCMFLFNQVNVCILIITQTMTSCNTNVTFSYVLYLSSWALSESWHKTWISINVPCCCNEDLHNVFRF